MNVNEKQLNIIINEKQKSQLGHLISLG